MSAVAGDEVRLTRLAAADDVELAVHRLGPPDGPPVLCVHGTFSNHRYWLGTRGSGFARALAERGYEAWVIDLRGHGDSPRPGRRDHWDFEDWARLDVTAALDAARAAARERGRPCFAVGHSAGGATLLMALAGAVELRDSIAGLVTAGTPLPWTQGFRGLAARTIRLATHVLPRFPARSLGLGPEDELNGVMRQWMGWNLEGAMTGRGGVDYGAALSAIDVPMLMIAGAGDRLFAPPDAVRALYDRVGAADRTLIVAGTATGFERDFGHPDLIASRAAAEQVWPRILDWLDAHEPGGAERAAR